MLFPDLQPKRGTLPEGIDLRCCDVAEVLAVARGARLVVADPPWAYERGPGNEGLAEDHYTLLSVSDIAGHVDMSFACADPKGCRLALWYTWPKSDAWETETILRREGHRPGGWRWGQKITGGSWNKEEGRGIGYHWFGTSEPVAVYRVGSPTINSSVYLSNGSQCGREEHSYKPVEWMCGWWRRWTSPGDLVLDLYAGLGSVAVACALEGRRYIGAEIDLERHRRAVLRVDEAYNNRR